MSERAREVWRRGRGVGPEGSRRMGWGEEEWRLTCDSESRSDRIVDVRVYFDERCRGVLLENETRRREDELCSLFPRDSNEWKEKMNELGWRVSVSEAT